MYIPKYFEAHEFVDRATYERWGERSLMFMDDRILMAADIIKDFYDATVTINDWYWGGKYEWSGLRTPSSKWYSTYSQHSFGRALDVKVKGVSPGRVREDLMGLMPDRVGIKAIELDTPTWVHIDCRNVEPNHESGYYVFQP